MNDNLAKDWVAQELAASSGKASPFVDTLIISKSNNYGLARDITLLRSAIQQAGGDVSVADIGERGFFDRFSGRKWARRIIHIERVHPNWLGAVTEETLLVPNQERFPRRQLGRLKHVDHILAKTHHAADVFSNLDRRTDYLGFSSEDRLNPALAKDWNRFFHLAGGSTLKGTEKILALWRRHPEWPELVLVQKSRNAPYEVPANVRLISGYLADAELRALQNNCGIHLCPSRAEGWGHHIVEAMSCGGIVITTDAPPMNEHVTPTCGILVHVADSKPRHLGTSYQVDPGALEAAIESLIAMAEESKIEMGRQARLRYEEIASGFMQRVKALLVKERFAGEAVREGFPLRRKSQSFAE